MRHFEFSLFGLVLTVLVFLNQPARAETFTMVVSPQAKNLFSYEFGVIEMALKYADGDHVLEIIEIPGLSRSRVFEMLTAGEVSITFAGYSKEREERFLQVDYPMTRGMLGHRVFMTQPDKINALSNVKSLAELQRFCIGSGSDWPDADILEKNGFCVVRAPRNQLFAMLEHGGRFDLLTRAVHEAYWEIEKFKKDGVAIALDENLMVVYPYDFFLYVRKDDLVRHAILEQGLQRAYASGAFMAHFTSHPTMVRALEELRPSVRKVFHVENPEMSVRTRNIDPGLWMGF